jgi:GNAT superfamily N-acetyltransferase
MQIRDAREEDAVAACNVVRRSITELCHADYEGDSTTLALWLANKTPDNMRRWIAGPESHVLVATESGEVVGVGALQSSGKIMLNYVSPDARFRGVSKALIGQLEAKAARLGIRECTLESTATARRLYRALGYRHTGPPRPGFGISPCYPMAKQICP